MVYVESSVMDDQHLLNNQSFLPLCGKLMSFKEGLFNPNPSLPWGFFLSVCRRLDDNLYFCDAAGKDDLTDKIDFIICLGGDGTLLYASSLFQVCVFLSFHLFPSNPLLLIHYFSLRITLMTFEFLFHSKVSLQ